MTPPDACPRCGTTGRKRKCCRPANPSSKLQRPSHTGASDNLKGDKRAESVNLDGDEATIKSFLTAMQTQDNRSTASPFYYVIRTEKEQITAEGHGEPRWYWNETTYESEEELEKDLTEYGAKRSDVTQYEIIKVWERRGMFLTERDAVGHLKANYYHYSTNAHTYVEHAWRAPELAEFFKALNRYFKIKERL